MVGDGVKFVYHNIDSKFMRERGARVQERERERAREREREGGREGGRERGVLRTT